MKVAIVSRGIPNDKYPLNGIFEFDQAKALAKKGIEVAFVAIDFRALSFKRKHGLLKYEREGVSVFELSLPIGVYRKALPVLQRLLLIPFRAMMKSCGKPDVIHAHFYSIAAIASFLKEKYGIPFVITEHSSKLNKPADQISTLDKKLATTAYSHCDRLIAVSQTLHNHLLENFHHDSIVIPNMVDNQHFQCRELPVDNTPFTFVSVGTLVPIKAFDKLIDAFSKMGDDSLLRIVGDGPEREKLEKQIHALGLENRVQLLGQLDRNKINDVFGTSNVFVLPSQSETFGVSYIEAMYAGLPVIATRCGGPESFVDNSNGILVPVDDTTALVDAMLKIRNDFHQYKPQQISDSCMKQYAPDVIAEKIIKAYPI